MRAYWGRFRPRERAPGSRALHAGAARLIGTIAGWHQLSAWMSRLVRQHAWASQRPRLSPEQQALADERTVALDEDEVAMWRDGGERRAAG